jgi:hypothetical protein
MFMLGLGEAWAQTGCTVPIRPSGFVAPPAITYYSPLQTRVLNKIRSFDSPAGEAGYIGITDIQLDLCWGASYQMLGLLKMFESTHDFKYLERFIRMGDSALANRDDAVKLAMLHPVWSSNVRMEGRLLAAAVATGMITFPLIEFSLIVKRKNLGRLVSCNGKSYSQIAAEYATKVEQSVQYHVPEFDVRTVGARVIGAFRAPMSTTTFFKDSRGYPMSQFEQIPYNMTHALGSTLVSLYAYTENPRYLSMVRLIASNFKAALAASPSTHYQWLYWGGNSNDSSKEDTSHGILDVQFAQVSYREGLSPEFRVAELNRFGNTVTTKILPTGSSGPYYNVYGEWTSKFDDIDARRSLLHWALLAPYHGTQAGSSQSSFELVNKVGTVVDRVDTSAFSLLGLARLLENSGNKYNNESCVADSQCKSNICFNGKCGLLLGYGSTCKRDKECASGICFNGQVCGDPLGVDSTCYRHHECVSGYCMRKNPGPSGVCSSSPF